MSASHIITYIMIVLTVCMSSIYNILVCVCACVRAFVFYCLVITHHDLFARDTNLFLFLQNAQMVTPISLMM